jgi:nucleoside-diphosphate-sugar epimerase
MKILITGSTGFVGKNLMQKLISEGHEILELTRSIKKSKELFGNETTKLKITDTKFKKKIVAFMPQVVIHLASYLTSSDKLKDINKLIDANIYFLSKVLDAVSAVDLKLFINTGTFAEYFKGDDNLEPAYFYAATKTASRSFVDYYSTSYKFKQCTIVPFTIYCSNDSQKKIIDIIYDSTNNNVPLDLSPGEQVLDFIHIDDVTDFYMTVLGNLNKLSRKSNFKLGTGIGHSLKELATKIEEVTQLKTNINWGGKQYRKSDVMHAVADIANLKKLFGWEPKISLEAGLLKVFELKDIN